MQLNFGGRGTDSTKNGCITELEAEESAAAFGVLDTMNFSFSSILRCKNLDLPGVHKLKF